MRKHSTHTKGTSLIEIVVAVGVMSLIAVSLFAVFRAMTTFSVRNELHNAARLLAEEHMEMIRALPYDNIGTAGGIPSGLLPQTETIAQENVTFTRRTFIQYVDDPADGTDAADTLAADYKRARVDVSYTYDGKTYSVPLVATIASRSQESLTGAGILRLVVVDTHNDPVPAATVLVENTAIATSVDVTTFTNANGTVSFPGAWEGAGYNILIEKAGYSSAGTYAVHVDNPNPSPSPATVVENATTEITFRIDLLSALNISTVLWPEYAAQENTFADTSLLAGMASTTVLGGDMLLSEVAGVYETIGSASSTPYTPPTLGSWLFFTASTTLPTNTDVRFRLWHEQSGTLALVPDTAIPQNSTGFASTSLDLSHLATSTYTTLSIETFLSTTDTSASPRVHEWRIAAQKEPVPQSTDIMLTSSKTIGADAFLNPIPKYAETHTTSADGTWATTTMEWDTYTVNAPAFDVDVGCPALPVTVAPNTTLEQVLYLDPVSTHKLTVTMQDTFGSPLSHGAVTLLETGETRPTNVCGVAHFSGLTNTTYTVVGARGAYHASSTTVAVDNATPLLLTLIAL